MAEKRQWNKQEVRSLILGHITGLLEHGLAEQGKLKALELLVRTLETE